MGESTSEIIGHHLQWNSGIDWQSRRLGRQEGELRLPSIACIISAWLNQKPSHLRLGARLRQRRGNEYDVTLRRRTAAENTRLCRRGRHAASRRPACVSSDLTLWKIKNPDNLVPFAFYSRQAP